MSKCMKQERIGERRQMNCGLWATLIDYKMSRKCRIRFDNGIEKNCSYKDFSEGTLTDKLVTTRFFNSDKIGMKAMMNCGEECEIIKSVDNNNVVVRFVNSRLIKHASFHAFKSGKIDNKEKNNFESMKDQEFVNKFGLKFRIKEVNKNGRKCLLEFEDGATKWTFYKYVRNGGILHPGFDRTGNMQNFHNYSGKLVKILDTYWWKVNDLGLITLEDALCGQS